MAEGCPECSGQAQALPAGQICHVADDGIYVATGEDFLVLEEIQLEGKKRMDISAFLNGYTIEKGTRMDFENETNE